MQITSNTVVHQDSQSGLRTPTFIFLPFPFLSSISGFNEYLVKVELIHPPS